MSFLSRILAVWKGSEPAAQLPPTPQADRRSGARAGRGRREFDRSRDSVGRFRKEFHNRRKFDGG